ncbi:uncharacterized protein N7515_002238 [Penicillium bovifimosum]|uniref:Uncharacterized protein n=1 Tax=Penicillium bovifimosum TaxID=126998 RepID=A0A9W9HD30_9EURO|nr:uncharacterized protein N7515_002238 [Penicillium bovifimosum]KAJ5143451.1 hypothetical protein N7515_002238 [Penicillium bovifimosum]
MLSREVPGQLVSWLTRPTPNLNAPRPSNEIITTTTTTFFCIASSLFKTEVDQVQDGVKNDQERTKSPNQLESDPSLS